MSHFMVGVICHDVDDIENLLEPYDENIEVPKYIQATYKDVVADYRKWHPEDAADMTDDECFQDYIEVEGYTDDMIDEQKNLYTTYNPNSKWDWWVVGGRWSGLVKLKNGRRTDEAWIRNCDFSHNQDLYDEAIRDWENGNVKGINLDKEKYAEYVSAFSTYAVVTPDGKWHAPGEVSWFGMSSESQDDHQEWVLNYKKNFIDPYPDCYFVAVDCHI